MTLRRMGQWGTAVLCLAVACGITGLAQQQKSTQIRVKAGTPSAKAVFLEACARCHPPERVTSMRRSKAQWEETINTMVTSRGATLTPEQYDTVLKYLVSEFGTETQTQTTTRGARTTGAQPPRPQARGGAGPDDKHIVDPAAAQRGRTTYAADCIQCHGTNTRGGDRGPNIVRSLVLLHDRYGSEIGPFLRKGHPMQGGGVSNNSTFTDAQIDDLSHFLHERLTDTLRGSPIFNVQNVLTGDKQAGAAYFEGAGGCKQCHSPTGDLAGIGKRYDPPALQQRFLFPRPQGRGPYSVGKNVTITVTTPSGERVSGVLLYLDDFTVSLRDDSGQYRSWSRTAGLTVEKHDPYAAHVALLDTVSDRNMHDVVAYLESLK